MPDAKPKSSVAQEAMRTRVVLVVALAVMLLATITASGLFFDVVPARSRIMRKKEDPRLRLARDTVFTTTTATAAAE